MPSRARPNQLSVERVVVRSPYLVFGTSNPAQQEPVATGQKVYSYSESVFSMNEENGGPVYVKRNLTVLRLWDRRRCGSDDNRFNVALPRSLEICENSQYCHTSNDHQH